jgi:general secretion pathway protein K
MSGGRRFTRQRGFALLIVLWSVALLALIGTRITAAGHAETRLATNLRAQAVAEAAADGAAYEALYHFLDGSAKHWPADGQARRIKLPQAVADVTMVDESRKISLNGSSLPLLSGLLHALGLERHLAAVLTARIGDWRTPSQGPSPLGAKGPEYLAAGRDWGPPDQPFRSIDELGMVLGMTPDVLARLRPYVSPWIQSSPSVAGSDPVVRAALTEAAASGLPPQAFDEPATLTIVAVAAGNGGGRFTRRMVVRMNGDAGSDPAQGLFVIVDWDQVPD